MLNPIQSDFLCSANEVVQIPCTNHSYCACVQDAIKEFDRIDKPRRIACACDVRVPCVCHLCAFLYVLRRNCNARRNENGISHESKVEFDQLEIDLETK